MPITFTIPDDALVEALARPEILEALRDLLEPDTVWWWQPTGPAAVPLHSGDGGRREWTFEPIHAELVAAAMRQRRPDRALLARARAGREAVMLGADPVLTLALVVWPNEKVAAAQTSASD